MKAKKEYILFSEGWVGTKKLDSNTLKNLKIPVSSLPKRENIIVKAESVKDNLGVIKK